jgi:CubicO group peptidase (beta-lactamase class C family)
VRTTSVDQITIEPPRVEGAVASGYEPVREAFATNLRVGEDVGAAVCIYRHGECVVDLWGGTIRRGGPYYQQDALQLLFSTSKGLVALCLAKLVDLGEVDLNSPVSKYWPEFAQGGKEAITVLDLATHQAGLSAFEATTSLADLADWSLCVGRLAKQSPAWRPGSAHGYHAVTFGYLLGEVIARVTGVSIGMAFRRFFGDPLNLNAWIGLPALEYARVVPLIEIKPPDEFGQFLANAESSPRSFTNRAFRNPVIDSHSFNQPTMFSSEIPAVNAISDARSLARLYATAVAGPLRMLSEGTVARVSAPQVDGNDLVLVDQPTRYGVGFVVSSAREPMLGSGSFGHNGRGGSLGFAHPESGVSYGYVANQMLTEPSPDRRNTRLLAALRECV